MRLEYANVADSVIGNVIDNLDSKAENNASVGKIIYDATVVAGLSIISSGVAPSFTKGDEIFESASKARKVAKKAEEKGTNPVVKKPAQKLAAKTKSIAIKHAASIVGGNLGVAGVKFGAVKAFEEVYKRWTED